MLCMKSRILILAASIAALIAAAVSPANAATKANYNVQYCASGKATKVGYNQLENGYLTFAWCYTSTGKMTTLTVRYDRESNTTPTTISVQFGYEWTTAGGTAKHERRHPVA